LHTEDSLTITEHPVTKKKFKHGLIEDIILHTEDSLTIKFLTCLELQFGQFRAILKKM